MWDVTQPAGIDGAGQRALNRALVFALVRRRRTVSQSTLARETGLSKATISEIVAEFHQAGFLRPVGPGPSNGGRRPLLLTFEPQARLAIGVEIGEAEGRAALVDLDATPRRVLHQPERAQTPEAALDLAASLIATLLAESPRDRLLGLGVGTPGLVDSQTGIIRLAPDLGWQEIPIGPWLAARFGLPVAVVNRAKAAALGEAWAGAGRQAESLVYLSVSTGIAAGFVVGGRLYRGVAQSEGEVGHTTVLPDGPLCPCGNRGCLQALAAGPAILARVRAALRAQGLTDLAGLPLDLLDLERLAPLADHPAIQPVLTEVAHYLGIAAANLVNIFNPRLLILGGAVIRALPGLVPQVATVVRQRALAIPAAAVQVAPAHLGRDAVAVGAAAFLLSQVPPLGAPAPGLSPASFTAVEGSAP